MRWARAAHASQGGIHRTSRVPKHHPVPNLLFAWDRKDPSREILGRALSPPPGQAEFPSRPPRDCGNRASSRPAAPTSHLPQRPLPGGSGRPTPPGTGRPSPSSARGRRHAPPRRADLQRRGSARPPAHPGGSGGVSIVVPLGLQNASTDRRRQHHSSRGRRHCPPAEPRSIRPRGGAARLTARHHLRQRPPQPWPAWPGALCLTARLPRSPECGAAATAGRAGSRARPLPGLAPPAPTL